MIKFDFDRYCCGCFVCLDSCPKKCIKQKKNRHGFLVPYVEESLCINCHACERVCPVLNPQKQLFHSRIIYSAFNKDDNIRAAGSSGSIFFSLAQDVILGGGAVFGAAFQDKLQLRHVKAETLDELRPLLKSKYLQSNTKGIYKSVREQIKTGRSVLFVGTPCQCNALYNFLGRRKPDNLLLVDFICHGVPSQDLFDKAVELYERKHNCVIEDFSFRCKQSDSVHYFRLKAKGMDGDVHYLEAPHTEFPYYYGFKKFICLRESCYRCKFCIKDRVSDITLGDFWGITQIDESIRTEDFNKGISLIVCNSNRGISALMSISDKLQIKEQKVKDISKINYAYTKPTKKGLYARQFWHDYDRLDYDELEKRHFTYVPFHSLSFFKKVKVYLIAKLGL